ncbi:unnamed protein product [Caenorhabditis brenneri]
MSSTTNANSIAEPTFISTGPDFLAGIMKDWMDLRSESAVNKALLLKGQVGISVNGQLLVGTLEIGYNANWTYGPPNAQKSVKDHYATKVLKPLSHIEWPLVWTREEPARRFPSEVVEIRDLEETRQAIKDCRARQSQKAKSQTPTVNLEKKNGELAKAEKKSIDLARRIAEQNEKIKKEEGERMAKEIERRKIEENARKIEKEAHQRAIKEAKEALHNATMAKFAAEDAERKAYEKYKALLEKQ